MKKVTWQKCIRKTVISAMLCSCLAAGFTGYSYAAAPEPEDEGGISIQAEQTQWCYRSYNGRVQKRLWSITEGKWLTEWEDC